MPGVSTFGYCCPIPYSGIVCLDSGAVLSGGVAKLGAVDCSHITERRWKFNLGPFILLIGG